MAVRDRLDRLRTQFPGCRIVAFVDLSTGMVFAASTSKQVPQEDIDRLCECARKNLCAPAVHCLADHVFDRSTDRLHAVVFDAQSTTCFIRSSVAQHDALCLVCDPGAPCADLIGQGANLLTHLGGEE